MPATSCKVFLYWLLALLFSFFAQSFAWNNFFVESNVGRICRVWLCTVHTGHWKGEKS